MSKLSTYEMPNIDGRYGNFGGRFVPELLMPALLELDEAYEKAMQDPIFTKELDRSEEHTSELQSRGQLVCRLLLEKKKKQIPKSKRMSKNTAEIVTRLIK